MKFNNNNTFNLNIAYLRKPLTEKEGQEILTELINSTKNMIKIIGGYNLQTLINIKLIEKYSDKKWSEIDE